MRGWAKIIGSELTIRRTLKFAPQLPLLSALAEQALTELEWLESWQMQGEISARRSRPWYTYAAASWLDQVVSTTSTILEVGAGASTLWWADRGCSVVALEASNEWAEKVEDEIARSGLESRARIIRITDVSEAVSTINSLDMKFDVVINDGVEPRSDLTPTLASTLSSSGLLVWDNSERAAYAARLDWLRNNGWWALDFFGLGPRGTSAWQTSVFFRQPIIPSGRPVDRGHSPHARSFLHEAREKLRRHIS